METHSRSKRLRRFSASLRQKTNMLQQKWTDRSIKIIAAAKAFSKYRFPSETEPKSEAVCVQVIDTEDATFENEENQQFHLFARLPLELKFKIWKHIAEGTTQVVSIAPYTTTEPAQKRNFKFYGSYRSLTPFPAFLQVNNDLRREGLKYYSDLMEDNHDFEHIVPFNYDRDILLISLRLSYSRLIQRTICSMLSRKQWEKIENICFQVSHFEMYPWHLEILDELPRLKQLHFTLWHSEIYRENVDDVIRSEITRRQIEDCKDLVGQGFDGEIDYEGLDEIEGVIQHAFHLQPLKMEFEYARHFSSPFVAFKLPQWSVGKFSQLDMEDLEDDDTLVADDVAGVDHDLVALDDG